MMIISDPYLVPPKLRFCRQSALHLGGAKAACGLEKAKMGKEHGFTMVLLWFYYGFTMVLGDS